MPSENHTRIFAVQRDALKPDMASVFFPADTCTLANAITHALGLIN